MKILKIGAGVVAVFLLAGCSSNSDLAQSPSPTPSSSPTSSSTVITGEPVVDAFIYILNASCKHGQNVGLAAYVPKAKQTTYVFPQADQSLYWQSWNMMTRSSHGDEISGWFDGDPICTEAAYANRVKPKGSPANANGVKFDYKYVEIKPGTVDWYVLRQSQELNPVRISSANGLVTTVEYLESKYVFEISYGPFSKKIKDAYQAALVSSGQQYMYLTPPMFGMTLAEAQAYAKSKGLTVLVGIKEGEDLFPSGPPGGISDPKRMIVNIMSGEIAGVWTM